MLKQLLIKNYALIRHLEIQPSNCLSVITGETGAGKSIMLGAIGLLLGNRADTKVLLNHGEKCIIEGEFDISKYNLKAFFDKKDLDFMDDCLIRREISPSGKSRGFINDTPVTLDVMRSLGQGLMDIHSQHETLLLAESNFQLNLIDSFAGCLAMYKDYAKLFNNYRNIHDAYRQLQQESQQISQDADYNQFLYDELKQSILFAEEVHEMEQVLKRMENAEEIKSGLHGIINLSGNENISIDDLLRQSSQALGVLGSYSEIYYQLAQRIDSMSIEWNDILDEIKKEEAKVEYDPQVAEEYREKLSDIYRLQKKHNVLTVEELQQTLEELEVKVSKASNLDEELQVAKDEMEKASTKALVVAKELSNQRKKALIPLGKKLVELIKELGIPYAEIKINHEEIEPGKGGIDNISILFSANKGIEPQGLKSVASGGEFSRLMFCIKYLLAGKASLPTIVFDEIDKGISGEIALKLGKMMKRMSGNHQVITISHLPQIAAKADTHYFVYKDNASEQSISKIKLLREDERIEEIAKMIAGDSFSESALINAKELIDR